MKVHMSILKMNNIYICKGNVASNIRGGVSFWSHREELAVEGFIFRFIYLFIYICIYIYMYKCVY
jgi:hypothetical protein